MNHQDKLDTLICKYLIKLHENNKNIDQDEMNKIFNDFRNKINELSFDEKDKYQEFNSVIDSVENSYKKSDWLIETQYAAEFASHHLDHYDNNDPKCYYCRCYHELIKDHNEGKHNVRIAMNCVQCDSKIEEHVNKMYSLLKESDYDEIFKIMKDNNLSELSL